MVDRPSRDSPDRLSRPARAAQTSSIAPPTPTRPLPTQKPRPTMLRQLDQRDTAGMTITLEWDSETDQVSVRCEDERTDAHALLCYPLAPHDARFAFLHPFAASPLHEPRPLDAGPSRNANDDRPPLRPVATHARTPGSADGAGIDVADETESKNSRRRRWSRLRPSPGPHSDRTELEH